MDGQEYSAAVPIRDTLERMATMIEATGTTTCDRLILCWMDGTRLKTLHTAVPPEVLALIHYELADHAAEQAPMPSGITRQ